MCSAAAFSFFHSLAFSEPPAEGLILHWLADAAGEFRSQMLSSGFLSSRISDPSGVFLRSRQPADPQADRPAGESAAIPSVEVCTSEVLTHFALLGGRLA